MELECLKLSLQYNEKNKNTDWRLGIEYRKDVPIPQVNRVTLGRMEKILRSVLYHDKRLAPMPSELLPLVEPVTPGHISQYSVDWLTGMYRYEVARYSRSYASEPPDEFGLLRIYPIREAISPQFFYLLLKVVLTFFDASRPSLSECFLKQDLWDFMFNDVVLRKYFFNDTTLPPTVGDSYGFIKS